MGEIGGLHACSPSNEWRAPWAIRFVHSLTFGFSLTYAPRVIRRKGIPELAKALVCKCLEMAKTEGISANDIEAEFGDIIEYVQWQIKRVNDDFAMSVTDIDGANSRRIDQQLEEGLINSFPASDPVSVTQPSKSRFEISLRLPRPGLQRG